MNARLFRYASVGALLTLSLGSALPARADTVGPVNFETYSTGTVNGQDGWVSTGAFDHKVADPTAFWAVPGFGSRALRISMAVTSGSFGDQTFSKPLVNEAGETLAINGGFSGGTRQSRFDASWEFASTVPGAEQPGMQVVASPDRGDGARMSWIQMKDTPAGLEVNFYDYQDLPPYGSNATPADGCNELGGDNWYLTNVVTGLPRNAKHSIRVVMDLVDGQRNDIVRIYVDGVLKHVGTSWEDYFRYCNEGAHASWPDQSVTVDSILFRTAGTAVPATLNNGFLIDNLTLASGLTPPPADLSFSPAAALVASGASLGVDLNIAGVADLYGYEFRVTFPPAMGTGTGTFINTFFDTTSNTTIPGLWSAACSAGECLFAASKTAPSGMSSTGSGTLGHIDFVAGTPGVYTVTYQGTLLSDPLPTPISVITHSAVITVYGQATVSGNVKLQGRATPITAGPVMLVDTTGLFVGPYATTYNATTGAFVVTVPALAAGTTYTLTADHDLYLGRYKLLTVTPGNTYAQPTTTLRGGDANNDERIALGDLTCIGSTFGTAVPTCTGGSSDINADGIVNIFDLVIAGGNYGLPGPGPTDSGPMPW